MQDTSVTPRLRQANLNWNIQRKLFPSLFAYFGWRLEEKVVLFVRRVNRLLRRPPPPKRFVGVGYRDNGHRRNVALDGSPSWQEVASVHLEDPNKSKRLRGFEVWSLLRKQALKFWASDNCPKGWNSFGTYGAGLVVHQRTFLVLTTTVSYEDRHWWTNDLHHMVLNRLPFKKTVVSHRTSSVFF